MYADRVRDGESKLGARRKVGELLGVNPATLRNWIESAEKADRPVEPSGLSLADENARLKKENAELRRGNAHGPASRWRFARTGGSGQRLARTAESRDVRAGTAFHRRVPLAAGFPFPPRRTPP